MTNAKSQHPPQHTTQPVNDSGADLFSLPTPRAPSWRDLVTVHRAAELFPMMADTELDGLGEDIADNGLRQGVVLWTPEPPGTELPKEIYLLDGRNRLEAIERIFAADPERRAEEIARALSWTDPEGTPRTGSGAVS